VSTTSIFLLAQIAAAEGRDVTTIDIGSAYLNALMPKTDPSKLVFMRISKEVSQIMANLDKTFNSFLNTDGTLVVELDIPALQGKTTFKTSEPFPTPEESLRDTTEQQLYADIFMANGLSFFITVAKPLEHIIATPIESRDIASLRKVMRHHLSCYSQRRISVPIIYSDNERGLAALSSELAAMGIQLIHSGPGMHVHVVERAIRYIKEGVRALHAGLPYTCPRALFRLLVPFVALRLNMFPTSTRTDRLSAFQIIYNRPADARRDCHLTFGAMYHITCRERSHSMAPRTVAAIGVAQIPNGTGTCSFYAIHNGSIINANHFTEVPMTPDMIRHMNRLAAEVPQIVILSIISTFVSPEGSCLNGANMSFLS
jgi:hypothetical protein